MAVGVYRNTDVGAPTLSGTAGALIGVLDHALVTGQGWSKVYSGTNLAVYRAPVAAGNRLYLRVDDTGTTSARVVGYETMSAVSTGTGAFPTEAQVAGGLYAPKSANADANARNWVIVANDRFFHMWANTASGGVTSETNGYHWMFGDVKSYSTTDPYGTILQASTTVGVSGVTFSTLVGLGTTQTGHYVARSHTQIGTSTLVGKVSDQVLQAGTGMGAVAIPYPNPAGGGLFLAPLRVHEGISTTYPVLRGELPGVWNPLHVYTSFADFDTVTGTGPLAGKTFLLLRQYTNGALALETSDTW
jgi:hypothetical protein